MTGWLAHCLAASVVGAAEIAAQEAADTALRRELLERVTRDQAIRDTLSAGLRATGVPSEATARRMMALDSANTAWLERVDRPHRGLRARR